MREKGGREERIGRWKYSQRRETTMKYRNERAAENSRKYGKRLATRLVDWSVRRLSKLTTRDRDTWQSLPSFRSCRDFFLEEGGKKNYRAE